MSISDDEVVNFVFEPGLDMWEADLPVPFWGEALPVRVRAPASGLSSRQIATLRAILAHQGDLRNQVAEALLAHYRRELEQTKPYPGRTPPPAGAVGMWALVSAVALYIPPLRLDREGVMFEFHMDCVWDVDHGLSVLVRNWSVAAIAGQMDCRGVSDDAYPSPAADLA